MVFKTCHSRQLVHRRRCTVLDEESVRRGDQEMHRPKKGNQWHLAMKAQIGGDAGPGEVQAMVGMRQRIRVSNLMVRQLR